MTDIIRKSRWRKWSNCVSDPNDAFRRARYGQGHNLLPRSRARGQFFAATVSRPRTGRASTRPFWRWYHVPCWLRSNTHTHAHLRPAISVDLHFALPCVTAYPVAPHPPTGFVPAPTQPPTYGGKNSLFFPSLAPIISTQPLYHHLTSPSVPPPPPSSFPRALSLSPLIFSTADLTGIYHFLLYH